MAFAKCFLKEKFMSFEIVVTDKKTASEKYQRIVYAAIKVFSQKGFFHAKVSDVAKAADVADGTIYLYFKNKDDLLVSIFEHSIDYFMAEVTTALKMVTDPGDKLRTFIQMHLLAVKKDPNLSQVLQIEARSSSKFMKEYKPEKFFEYLRLIENIIIEGQNKGVFNRKIHASVMNRSIFGAIDELALEWILTKKKRFEIEEAASDLADLLLNGIKGQV